MFQNNKRSYKNNSGNNKKWAVQAVQKEFFVLKKGCLKFIFSDSLIYTTKHHKSKIIL